MVVKEGVTPVQQGGLGDFVRRRRKELGISSQEKLSELAGLPDNKQRLISRIERGENLHSPIPEPHVLSGIARALRVTEAELLREAGYLSDSIAAVRLDDRGDEYAASQDRWAAEHPDEVQRIADRISDRFRQVVIEELSAERPDVHQLNFGGIR